MDLLAGVLLTISNYPHSPRAHHVGAAGTYLLLTCIRPRHKAINKCEVYWTQTQVGWTAALFSLASVAQPSSPAPLSLIFLPLFLVSFQDFTLAIFCGALCAFCALGNLGSTCLQLASTAALAHIGRHSQRPTLYAAGILHLLCAAVFEGPVGWGCAYGAYAAVARFLYLRRSPFHLRGLLALSPLALVDLFHAEQIPLLFVFLTLCPLLARGGRDAFPFVTVPISCALVYARREGRPS